MTLASFPVNNPRRFFRSFHQSKTGAKKSRAMGRGFKF
jgi:hypothetical protein